jgi:hypothetical protein
VSAIAATPSGGSQHLPDWAARWPALLEMARPVRNQGKSARKTVEATICKWCGGRFRWEKFGEPPGRDSKALPNHFSSTR